MTTAFDSPSFDGHETVSYASCPETGLRAIIAIHSTPSAPPQADAGCVPMPRPMKP